VNRISPGRYFTVIKLHPVYALIALLVVLAMSLWTLMLSRAELDAGLGMLLFVQMFLASSGFVVRARCGHFDPVLAGDADIPAAAAWHWTVSVCPGMVAWLILGLTGWFVGSPIAVSALVGRRAVAMFIVSAVAWSAGFLLPRGAAGVVWLGALLALLLRRVPLLPSHAGPLTTVTAIGRQAVTVVGCPFLLIGDTKGVAPMAVAVAASIAAIALLATWRAASEVDIHLVNRA